MAADGDWRRRGGGIFFFILGPGLFPIFEFWDRLHPQFFKFWTRGIALGRAIPRPFTTVITSKIVLWTFERFLLLVTSLYNGCLKEGCFPIRWKRAKIIPLTKPGKEKCSDASKYWPISLLNTGGKVLEKLLINRIIHFLYTNDLLNQKQFWFTPQKSTTEAAMVAKDFIDEALT